MTTSGAFKVSDWNGSSGERWTEHQHRLDHMLEVFGEAAIVAADPGRGERVLDIGCGAGATSRALAHRVGAAGHVLGLDISASLVELARSVEGQGPAPCYELGDAATAAPGEGSFDVLYSRFGVMFFDDPVAAFAHMRTALKPGGRVAFACWRGADLNDWVRLPMGAVRGIVPPPGQPDPEAPGPFSFGSRERVERILAAAGFVDIALAAFDSVIPFGMGDTREGAIDDALHMAFEVGPLARALADQPDDVRERAAHAVRTAFAARPGERSVLIDGAAWIVTARNPERNPG